MDPEETSSTASGVLRKLATWLPGPSAEKKGKRPDTSGGPSVALPTKKEPTTFNESNEAEFRSRWMARIPGPFTDDDKRYRDGVVEQGQELLTKYPEFTNSEEHRYESVNLGNALETVDCLTDKDARSKRIASVEVLELRLRQFGRIVSEYDKRFGSLRGLPEEMAKHPVLVRARSLLSDDAMEAMTATRDNISAAIAQAHQLYDNEDTRSFAIEDLKEALDAAENKIRDYYSQPSDTHRSPRATGTSNSAGTYDRELYIGHRALVDARFGGGPAIFPR